MRPVGGASLLVYLLLLADRHIGATPRRTSTSFGFANSNVGTWTRLDDTGSTPTIIRRRTHRRGSRLSSSGSWEA